MKEMTNLEWYKLCIWAYSKIYVYGNSHKHHIKPKCLYPNLVDDKKNIIEVPAIVHWALHKLLFDYYVSVGNDEAVEKLRHVDIESFINEGQKNYAKNHPTSLYDFSKADEMMEFIKTAVNKYALAKMDYDKAHSAHLKYLYKRIKDMSEEEKQARTNARNAEKNSNEHLSKMKRILSRISDVILSKFGIEIKDELEPFSDKDVSNLIGCQKLPDDP